MGQLIRITFATLLSLALGLPAAAQSWVTYELCRVDAPAIDPLALPPDRLAELRDKAAQVPNARGNFWRITAPSGAVSHLWGTMHSSNRHVLDLPDRVIGEIESARLLAIETDYTADTRAELQRHAMLEGWYRAHNGRDPVPYKSLELPTSITAAIGARLEATGWGWEARDLLTLGGLLEAVWSDPCEDFAGGIIPVQDGRIQMLAHVAGVPTIGLEPPDRFLRRVNRAGARDLAFALLMLTGNYLEETDPATGNAERATWFALYLAGEHALLELWDRAEIITRFGPETGRRVYDTAMAYLLTERNLDFRAAIRDDLARGGVFMAIGSSHIAGKAGMVELLRNDGFTVTRIKLDRER